MTLRLGDLAPDFSALSTEGRIEFHERIAGSWAVLFSHPKDFTPVCTTELGCLARLKPAFDKRGIVLIGLSVDPVSDHLRWAEDIRETQGLAPNYPVIGDEDLMVAKLYEMLPARAGDSAAGRSALDNQTVRVLYVIDPARKIRLTITYPMTTGRNFEEVLRVIDALQLTDSHKVATPVNWRQGEDVIIAPLVSDAEARVRFPAGWTALKPYLRIVPQPTSS